MVLPNLSVRSPRLLFDGSASSAGAGATPSEEEGRGLASGSASSSPEVPAAMQVQLEGQTDSIQSACRSEAFHA